ncbi:hypothetical protein RIF29_29613 [Crotalaria pallida]|uniref:Uncharacterized protein n=1 Tax=Crotalaria pallida TaxID=3830 RepID=A0AAN9EF68_CROPI
MDKSPKEKEPKTPPPTSPEQSSATSAGTINPDWPTLICLHMASWHQALKLTHTCGVSSCNLMAISSKM